MKAIGCYQALPSSDENALIDIELPTPEPGPHDILVAVQAVSVNPIDCKMRMRPPATEGQARVVGWDAVGVVKAIGDKVSLFRPGDEVWYAGDVTRAGANSEFHLVDERIVGLKPKSLSAPEAAALPLTSITAWELLFDRLKIARDEEATLLVTGAAGGVGSILVQLARQLTKLTVIATASRQASQDWVASLGAHHVINHHQPLKPQLNQLGFEQVDYVISLTHTDEHALELVEALKPQGHFALIDDPQHLDIKLFKLKSIAIYWEMMFTRSMFRTPDMIRQHEILTNVARLVDEGALKTTLSENFGVINAANLRRAHALIEQHKARGKIVLSW